MTIKHLKIFVAVCEYGGITKAANALHLAQPSVSTAIAELERHYNLALFDRINQRLVLTELGGLLLYKAQSVLSQFNDFEEAATQSVQHPSIRIGSSLTLGKTVLPSFFTQLKELFPQISPTFVIKKTAMIEEMLEKGTIDIGIVEGDIRSAHLIKKPFGYDSLTIACAPDFPVPEKLSVSRLITYPLLVREVGSASRDLFDAFLAKKHLTMEPFTESVSNDALVAFAKAGHGITILPEGIVQDAVSNKRLRTLSVDDADLKRVHYIAIHKNKPANSIQRAVFNAFSVQ